MSCGPAARCCSRLRSARSTHFAPYHYATGFNRYFYEHHLERLGVQIEEIAPNGNWFESLAQELRRVDQVALTYDTPKLRPWERLAQAVLLRRLSAMTAADAATAASAPRT